MSYYKYLKYKSKIKKYKGGSSGKDSMTDFLNNDMENILSIANKVNIIGFSEATHGQQLITKFRMKVFKNLVKKCGYTIFILEEQYSCCELINKYIKNGVGNPEDVLISNFIWFWQSKEMLKLIIWMRNYNVKHNNILEFKGLDMQCICNDYDDSNDEVAKYVKNQARSYLDVDHDDNVEADGTRDKIMYRTFIKIYRPGIKYFIYMQAGHISKHDYVEEDNESIDWLGSYLSKEFGSNYYAVGNIFVNGTYLETKTKQSNEFVILDESITIPGLDADQLAEGLTIYRQEDKMKRFFDAIMVIRNEVPLELIPTNRKRRYLSSFGITISCQLD